METNFNDEDNVFGQNDLKIELKEWFLKYRPTINCREISG